MTGWFQPNPNADQRRNAKDEHLDCDEWYEECDTD